jgi:hypothetical protein
MSDTSKPPYLAAFSPFDVDLRPPRSPRLGLVVLDDQLPQNPLGRRHRKRREALRRTPTNHEPLAVGIADVRFAVDYERLVNNPESEARRLVAACGLEWEPGCLEFHRTERPVRTASVTQVRQPIYRKALGRWRRYAPYLSDFFARLPRP